MAVAYSIEVAFQLASVLMVRIDFQYLCNFFLGKQMVTE